jgi:ribonuclease-3
MADIEDWRRFQKVIGYKFHDRTLLEAALTHSSFNVQAVSKSPYERLEWLGDSLLTTIIAEELYRRYSDRGEGDLARCRSALINGQFLAALAREYGIDKMVRCQGILHAQRRDSIQENTLEALIGAIFLDSKYQRVKKVVLQWYNPFEERLEKELKQSNPKGRIQELICSLQPHSILDYRLIAETGVDHEKTYSVALYCEQELLGIGSGASKKVAEKNAAFHALEIIFQRAKVQP